MNMPGRIFELLGIVLSRKFVEKIDVLVNRFRNNIKMQTFRRLGLLVHIECQAFGWRVLQPVIDRDAIAFGLGNLLPKFIVKQLVGQVGRGNAAEDIANAARQPDGINQVFARHFIVNAQRVPAHGPIALPL